MQSDEPDSHLCDRHLLDSSWEGKHVLRTEVYQSSRLSPVAQPGPLIVQYSDKKCLELL
jgi:hypothetical protein